MSGSTKFSPTLPLTIQAHSSLSQDYIPTADILVDSESSAPVAVFSSSQGESEALVVSDGKACHVRRDSGTASGWGLVQLPGGKSALEVAAGRQFDEQTHGFYHDGSNLYHSTLGADGTWSGPDVLPLCTNLKVAYTPSADQFVLYGVTGEGDLQIVRQPSYDGPWEETVCSLGNQLAGSSPVLVMIDDDGDWVLAAAVDGTLTLWTGQLGATQPASGPDPVTTQDDIEEVVLGHQQEGSAMFMFIDKDHSLYNCVHSTTEMEPLVTSIPDSQVEQASGLVDGDGMLHVHSVDSKGGLWVLHQIGWNEDGSPKWAPYIALDVGIARVVSDPYPQDAVNLFALDNEAGALRLHYQDQATMRWNSLKVQQPGGASVVYPVPRYRTEVTLLDANGNHVPNYEVTVKASSTVAASVGQSTHQIGPEQSQTLTTDVFGKITLATLATGVHTPALTITAEGLDQAPPIQPAAEIHTYLSNSSGKETLNYLPTFGATTLQQAKVDGNLLAPGLQGDNPPLDPQSAANGVMHAMQVGVSSESPGAWVTASPPMAGFAVNLHDPSRPGFRTFATHDELRTYLDSLSLEPLGDTWSDIERFFEDIWNGIKTAAIAIKDLVVDVEKKVVSFAVQMGDRIAHFFSEVKIGLEEAVSFVHGILNAVGAFVEKVIDWLKAFFSWKDIWDTKLALEGALTQVGPYLDDMITNHAEPLVNGFFKGLEDQVKDKFEALKGQFKDGRSLTDMVNRASGASVDLATFAAPTGARAFSRHSLYATPAGTPIRPEDFTSNAHHNSFLDKLLSYVEIGPVLPEFDVLEQPLTDLADAMESASKDFDTAWQDFGDIFLKAVTDPKDFGALQVVEFLDMVEHLCLAALEFADGVVEAVLDLAKALLDMLDRFWTADFHVPFVSDLIDFIHDLVDPDGPPWRLSLAGLSSLVLAIPLTLVYKLIHGADVAPFPGGKLPQPRPLTGANGIPLADINAASTACKFVGVGVQAIWAGFDTVLDAYPDSVIEQKGVGLQRALGGMSVIFAVAEQVFTWPTDDYIPFTPIPLETEADAVVCGNWTSYWVFPLADIAMLCGTYEPWKGTLARYEEPTKIATSAFGAWSLVLGIWESAAADEDPGLVVSNILGPLSYAFQFLRLKSLEESSAYASWAYKLVIDLVTGEGTALGMAAG